MRSQNVIVELVNRELCDLDYAVEIVRLFDFAEHTLDGLAKVLVSSGTFTELSICKVLLQY